MATRSSDGFSVEYWTVSRILQRLHAHTVKHTPHTSKLMASLERGGNVIQVVSRAVDDQIHYEHSGIPTPLDQKLKMSSIGYSSENIEAFLLSVAGTTGDQGFPFDPREISGGQSKTIHDLKVAIVEALT